MAPAPSRHAHAHTQHLFKAPRSPQRPILAEPPALGAGGVVFPSVWEPLHLAEQRWTWQGPLRCSSCPSGPSWMLLSRGLTIKALKQALEQGLEPRPVPVSDKEPTPWLAERFCQQWPCEPSQAKERRQSISYAWVWVCSTSPSQDQNISYIFFLQVTILSFKRRS